MVKFKELATNHYIGIDKAIEKGIKVYKVVKVHGKEKRTGKPKVYQRKPNLNKVYVINERGHFVSPEKVRRDDSVSVITVKDGKASKPNFKFFRSRSHLKKTINRKRDNLDLKPIKQMDKNELFDYAQSSYKTSGSNVKRFYIWSYANKILKQKDIPEFYKQNIETWLDTNLNTVKKEIRNYGKELKKVQEI